VSPTEGAADPPPGRARGPAISGPAAAALVFGSSGAVLVVEIVSLRLLAPYFGLTLEMSTLVIGLALAAIAAGAWLGGRWADEHDPRLRLGLLLGVSGAVVAATPFALRGVGGIEGAALVPIVATATIVVPGALLSAVTPMVTKLRLASLDETGTVVGRLSGIATVGAIVGTVVTGFFLISVVPVTWIMVGLGALLAAGGLAVEIASRRRAALVAGAVVLVGGLGASLAPSGCDAETKYHCAVVVDDPVRADGYVLRLDNLRHSFVDTSDPQYLEFAYVRALAAAVDSRFEPGAPLEAHHLGAGGLTLPRYLADTRPGTRSTVSEIDPGVVRIDRERLGLGDVGGLAVRIEDARLGLRELGDDGLDLVVGDAFGGVSVPWHLATREFVTDVRRVLAQDAMYAANIIDFPPLAFARAEVATVGTVFEHVALAAEPAALRGEGGGNLVLVASPVPMDTAAWQAAIDERHLDWEVLDGAALDAWVGDAPVLTDDYAPVDQLLTPYPSVG
jgi:spermidine synthase